MITLTKNPNKDFIILNLTDTQLSNDEWADGHNNRKILEYTITELVQRVKPDLITVSGDLAWAGNYHAYTMLAKFLEGFQTPWAFVFGNHDAQDGPEPVDKVATEYLTYPHCVFEKGDPALGNGNYVICIQENEKIVEALIMMDSHSQVPFVDKDGSQRNVWAKLIPAQIDWYKAQAQALKTMGCESSTLLLHIPIYAYETASKAAYKSTVSHADLTFEQSKSSDCWNAGYEESVGVQYEGVSCYPAEDNVFAAIKEEGITSRVLCGHDHVNNWMINYDGVTLIYGLNTGAGCYWNPLLNGGTVLKVGAKGVYGVQHEFVDVSAFLEKETEK